MSAALAEQATPGQRPMEARQLVERLEEFPWGEYGVEYVLLFGSAARGERAHDVDLGVRFAERSYEAYLRLLEALAVHLGVREDHIDIVDLGREELPAELVMEIYTRGRLLYCRDLSAFLDEALRRVNVSYDFLIDCRKLRLLETALEAVRRSWER